MPLTESPSGSSPGSRVPLTQNMMADLQHILVLGAFYVLLCFLTQGLLLTVVDIQYFRINLGTKEAMMSGLKENTRSSLRRGLPTPVVTAEETYFMIIVGKRREN